MGFTIAIVAGIMSWSLLEYLLHRFFGHDKRTMPNFFSPEHTRHHSVADYFAPNGKKAVYAFLTLAAVAPLAVLAVGTTVGLTFALSFVAMFVTYEVVHRRAHTHPGIGGYARYIRRHHFHHHFENPKANHGVTSPIWDFVFGTYEPVVQIRVPAKMQMRWLKDPDTGKVRAAFADWYDIV